MLWSLIASKIKWFLLGICFAKALRASLSWNGQEPTTCSACEVRKRKKGRKKKKNYSLLLEGNHEERLIRQRKKFLKGTFDPVGNPDVTLMSSLSEEDFEWLSNLPYTIDFPLDKIMVVHAGLFSVIFGVLLLLLPLALTCEIKAKSLASHTPFELTEMRGVTLDGEAEKICADPTRQWAKLFDGNVSGGKKRVFGSFDFGIRLMGSVLGTWCLVTMQLEDCSWSRLQADSTRDVCMASI
jgi:hypothetical protein